MRIRKRIRGCCASGRIRPTSVAVKVEASHLGLKVNGRQPKQASFILCVGSRCAEGFTGCSRYCCPTAIKQAIRLCRQGIDTTIFYRDIRTISTGAEEMYREARGMGVLFVRIPPGEQVEVVGKERAEGVRCFDDLLGRRLEVPTDLVVLSVGTGVGGAGSDLSIAVNVGGACSATLAVRAARNASRCARISSGVLLTIHQDLPKTTQYYLEFSVQEV